MTVCFQFVCCFTSKQHLGSYQDGYWFVTVCTHGNVIVLPYWDTRPLAPWPAIPLSHTILTLRQLVLAECQARSDQDITYCHLCLPDYLTAAKHKCPRRRHHRFWPQIGLIRHWQVHNKLRAVFTMATDRRPTDYLPATMVASSCGWPIGW